MKKHLFLPMILVLFASSSCQKDDLWRTAPGAADNTEQKAKSTYDRLAKDHLKIAVLSDIHYLDPSLIREEGAQTGTPFLEDMMPNKALQPYSVPIFRQALNELSGERPDILLIAGDMAKDGELVSHEAVAGLLTEFQNHYGSKVYVTIGNNDINNQTAVAYTKNARITVPYATPEDFTRIYGAFGYTNTQRDPNSLSYVAEPFPGLWILSIDAAHYAPYDRKGSIKPETLTWIRDWMRIANEQNITVLGLMHHNLFEHFTDQNTITRNTVVENTSAALETLAIAGLKVILTGHNHAIDITRRTYGGKAIYDIETGSLITPPSSYRILTLKNKELDIDTRHITSIEASLPGNQEFTQYGQKTLSDMLDIYFKRAVKVVFGVPDSLIERTTPLVRNAYMAHMAGDERISPQEQYRIDALEAVEPEPKNASSALTKLWTDLGVKDHKGHIKMTNP